MRKPTVEDILLWSILILFAALMLWLLTGCAAKKRSEYDILWIDGKCILHVNVTSIESAKKLGKDWQFKDCEVQTQIEG